VPPPRLLPARRLPTTPPSRSARRSRYRRRGDCCPTSATAAGTGTTAGTRAGEAAAGGMATAASDLDAVARSAGSATGMAAAAGARVGIGTRHQLRHCDRRARAQHGRGRGPENTRRVRGCSCTALPIPVLPLCTASQLARIAYGSAEPQLSPLCRRTTARDDPRGDTFVVAYWMYLLLLILTTALD